MFQVIELHKQPWLKLRARDVVSLVQCWLLCPQAAVALNGAREVLFVKQLRHLWLMVRLEFLGFACCEPATVSVCAPSDNVDVVHPAEPAQETYEEKRQDKIRNIAIIAHGASWYSACQTVVAAATRGHLRTSVPRHSSFRLSKLHVMQLITERQLWLTRCFPNQAYSARMRSMMSESWTLTLWRSSVESQFLRRTLQSRTRIPKST